MSDCKLVDISIDPNEKFIGNKESDLVNTTHYQKLVGRLIYILHTRLILHLL